MERLAYKVVGALSPRGYAPATGTIGDWQKNSNTGGLYDLASMALRVFVETLKLRYRASAWMKRVPMFKHSAHYSPVSRESPSRYIGDQ